MSHSCLAVGAQRLEGMVIYRENLVGMESLQVSLYTYSTCAYVHVCVWITIRRTDSDKHW